MEGEGGGVVTPRRLSSQHSTLRETFLASDLAESLHNNPSILNDNNNNNNNNNSLVSPRPMSNLTLGAVLNSTKKSPPPNNVVVRTLLEIIRNDETLIGGSGSSSSNPSTSKKSWKSFTDRLKLKKTSNQTQNQNQNQNPNNPHQWAPSLPVPQSDVLPRSRSLREEAMNAHMNSLQALGEDTNFSNGTSLRDDVIDDSGSPRNRGSFRLSEALAAEREETHQRMSIEVDGGHHGGENMVNIESTNSGNQNEEQEEEERPVRMSLMDLLEEAEQQFGVRGPMYRLEDNEESQNAGERGPIYRFDDIEENQQADEEDIGKDVHSCCVCMVRHKGAAFIPCGHTFCRKCSRELWVQRGNCPLCNNFILEILDIF